MSSNIYILPCNVQVHVCLDFNPSRAPPLPHFPSSGLPRWVGADPQGLEQGCARIRSPTEAPGSSVNARLGRVLSIGCHMESSQQPPQLDATTVLTSQKGY